MSITKFNSVFLNRTNKILSIPIQNISRFYPVSSEPGDTEKTLWAWGRNDYGQSGQEDLISRSSPVQVGSDTDWSTVISSNYDVASIKIDGSLWTWGGFNTYGQLGQGDTIDRSSPVQVGSDTDWSFVSCGSSNMSALRSDRSLWSWGRNNYAQLGLGNVGDNTNQSSPVQVGSDTDWDILVCGPAHTMSIKTDGSLWGWGKNNKGELGLGDVFHKSNPNQVGSATDWSDVSCGSSFTIAIKTDNTIWSWGEGTNGKLGQGDLTDRSSPTQIGSDTDWQKVACSDYYVLAIKTDGTLWSWGKNDFGNLGQGDTTQRSSPIQVGSDTNWVDISCRAGNASLALKSDNTLWSWGYNAYGQLGLGDTTYRSSPVQVGSDTDWDSITMAGHDVISLRSE
jgi:alpha-tubulin suppressor-like RCC1 family protein